VAGKLRATKIARKVQILFISLKRNEKRDFLTTLLIEFEMEEGEKFTDVLQNYLSERGIDDKLYSFLDSKCTGLQARPYPRPGLSISY
jgi:hypothetical protein